MFPVYGSASLFGLYVLIKKFSKELVGYLLSFYFGIVGVFSAMTFLEGFMPESIYALKKNSIIKYKVDFKFITEIKFDININQLDILTGLISLIPTYFYLTTKHWNLNNMFAIVFSV